MLKSGDLEHDAQGAGSGDRSKPRNLQGWDSPACGQRASWFGVIACRWTKRKDFTIELRH